MQRRKPERAVFLPQGKFSSVVTAICNTKTTQAIIYCQALWKRCVNVQIRFCIILHNIPYQSLQLGACVLVGHPFICPPCLPPRHKSLDSDTDAHIPLGGAHIVCRGGGAAHATHLSAIQDRRSLYGLVWHIFKSLSYDGLV